MEQDRADKDRERAEGGFKVVVAAEWEVLLPRGQMVNVFVPVAAMSSHTLRENHVI